MVYECKWWKKIYHWQAVDSRIQRKTPQKCPYSQCMEYLSTPKPQESPSHVDSICHKWSIWAANVGHSKLLKLKDHHRLHPATCQPLAYSYHRHWSWAWHFGSFSYPSITIWRCPKLGDPPKMDGYIIHGKSWNRKWMTRGTLWLRVYNGQSLKWMITRGTPMT